MTGITIISVIASVFTLAFKFLIITKTYIVALSIIFCNAIGASVPVSKTINSISVLIWAGVWIYTIIKFFKDRNNN